MPLYTYTCQQHGTFKAWNKMAASDEPQSCPSCAGSSPRALAAPTIGKSDDGFGSFAGAGDMAGCGDGMCASEGSGGGHVCGAGCMH